MKKLFVLLLMLLTLANVASADFAPPMAADGNPIVLNCIVPYGEGLLIHYYHGATIYLSDAQDNWQAYSIRYENTEAREADFQRLIAAFEDQGLFAELRVDGLVHFVSTADGLLAVSKDHGFVYRVTFEGSEAVFTYATLLDALPEKKSGGDFRVKSAFADGQTLYLLSNIQDNRNRVTYALYAYDLNTWARQTVPTGIESPSFAAEAYPWQDDAILLIASTSGNWQNAGTYVLDPATGKKETLQAALGLTSLPSGSIYGCDAAQGIVIYRELTDDLYRSVSLEGGVVPFTRMKSVTEVLAFHPDGRLLRVNPTEIEELYPLQEMIITQLQVIGDGFLPPRIAQNSTIPDIQLITDECFAVEETATDVFANAMTTQSDQYDIFILPIMQAESIIRKGYCVPMTSEAAQDFVANMYPHMAKQLTNEDGELVMVPVQLLRRKTIAYDMRAAELLGIDPEDMPTTYEELFEFMRNFEYDYGDLALEYDISLFDTSTARNIGTLRQRMVEDTIALSRVDRKTLQAHVKEIGKLLDDTMKLSKDVKDVVSPYFYMPEILFSDSTKAPEHLDEPAFLFTLNNSPLPSDHSEAHTPYRYLLYTQPFDLALTEDIDPVAIYSGYAMVINPYSTKQDAALRYMDYVLNNMDGDDAANVLMTAEPVPSMYMTTYTQMTGWLEASKNDPSRADYCALLRETIASLESFLYDIPQEYLDTYQASVEITLPVWLDVKDAFAPCNAAWEQFLRSSIDGQQLLRRVLEVSQMIEFE